MTEAEIKAFKEQAIGRDVRSVTNQLNHAFNQGVALGMKIMEDKYKDANLVTTDAINKAVDKILADDKFTKSNGF